jgi:hypothetical protein
MAKVEKERDGEAAITAAAVTVAMLRDWAAADSFGQAMNGQTLRQHRDRAGHVARFLYCPA